MSYQRTMAVGLTAALLLLVAPDLYAQGGEESRWTIYQRFQSSSGDYGQILKLDSGVTYDFGYGVSLGLGAPYYFVRNTVATEPSFNSGVGNAYVNLGLTAPRMTWVRYYTSVKVGVPTGNEDQGFSTGKVTVDWSNYVDVPLGRVTPFANVGVANTVSDTSFFTRPFSSVGLVAHLQGGATWTVAPTLTLNTSGYAVVPSGEQTIVPRLRGGRNATTGPGNRPFETDTEVVGDAGLARDHGFSGWVGWYATRHVDLYTGYTRSISYDSDSVFFGLRWNFRVF